MEVWLRRANASTSSEEWIVASTSLGIFVIEINMSTFTSSVLDTGCGSHICDVQGLRMSRALTKGEVDLQVGNGAKVVALVVGTYVLTLSSNLLIQFENCYYVLIFVIYCIRQEYYFRFLFGQVWVFVYYKRQMLLYLFR